jgi:cell wall-associated NlpC family hydrolase
MYAGDGRMLHAPEAGRQVVLEPISSSARERTVGFGRYPAP